MELLDARGCRLQGLFTFAQSAKHVGLYQRFGFWPRYLVAVMARPAAAAPTASWSTYAEAGEAVLPALRTLTDAVYDGLDVGTEVRAVHVQGLGDTVLLHGREGMHAFAVCHCGPGSEAGSGVCYVKVGTVAPGPGAGERLEELLDACGAFAAARGLATVVAGVDTGQRDAYRRMIARGFRTVIQGVQMTRGDDPGFSRSDRPVLADWR
jgi:hypothetical protein